MNEIITHCDLKMRYKGQAVRSTYDQKVYFGIFWLNETCQVQIVRRRYHLEKQPNYRPWLVHCTTVLSWS